MRRKHTQWVFYVVRCIDDSLYAGITNDVKRRVNEHNTSKKGAKYTRSRRPVRLVFQRVCNDKSEALLNEIGFKKLKKAEKEKFVMGFGV